MKNPKASRFSLTFLLLLAFGSVFAQDETFKYKGEKLQIYPHKRKASPAWLMLEAINRKNKTNVEHLFRTQMTDYGFTEEDDIATNMDYFESEVFGAFRPILKPKQVQEIRRNATRFFQTPVNLHQNITPSIDVLPDGKYIQFYEGLFALNDKGDIIPYEGQVAGIFYIKNNLLDGYAYWLSTAGDTIESGIYREGKREGKWTFYQKTDFDPAEITDTIHYDRITCEYKDGLLDGPYEENFNNKVRFKGFYTQGEASGEWFFYNEDYLQDPVSKLYEHKYYLYKHMTYADKDAPVSHKVMVRGVANQGLIKSDSVSLPDNIYQAQVDFNHLFKFFKPEVEELELPEEKMTSYDGSAYDLEGGYELEGDYADDWNYMRYSNEKSWYNGKQLSRSKLIDSIGIQNLYKNVYEEFYPNGQLKFRYRYENGDLVHEDTIFWDNGQASNVVLYDKNSREYSVTVYDYKGKLLSVSRYDSLGEFVNSPVKYERYPKVMIDGLVTNFHSDFNYYERNAFDTLTKATLTEPLTLYKSWYFDKMPCAESTFNPAERQLNVLIRSVNQTPLQVTNYTFGEDYSYFSHRGESFLQKLKAITISNGSYSGSYHKDSLPQSKIYYLRSFETTDDYTLTYEDVPFSGDVVLEMNSSKPAISIKKNAIRLASPKQAFTIKLVADYLKFQKTGKAKYDKYYPYLDLGLNFESLFRNIFPFASQIADGVDYNPYDYDETELYQQEAFGSSVVRIEGKMLNGKPVGKWIAYDQKGKIRKETNFENGERQGEERTYAFAHPKPKVRKPRKGEEYYDEYYMPDASSYKNYPLKTTYYLQHVVHYNKGMLNGEEKYYDWEGKINFEAFYKDGFMEGPSLERNKLITTRSSYRDGLLDGIMRTDLTLPGRDTITLYDLNFQNQQLQGESKAYHPNGMLAKRGFFLNNQPIDDYEAFDTLGTKYHYVKFQYSFPVEEKIWEENELSVRYLFDWRDSIYFQPDDLIAVPSTYDLLMQYGLMDEYALEQPYYGRPSLIDKSGVKYQVTKYFPDQVIARDGPVDKGKKVGCWYYNNYGGVKLYEVDYFDTILKINDSIKFKSKGIRTDYDSLGNALFTSYVIEKIENYDCSHTDHYEVRQFMTIWQKDSSYNRFNGYVKNYYDDGTLQSEGTMKNGLPTGVWKYYTPNGQLNQVGEYVMGKRNGRWLRGDLSKTNYLGDICLNPNLPDLEKRLQYQEKLLDINIRYFKLGKVINSEYYDINMNRK